jgi:LysR family transcriptional regulator, hydrogen peroxide-inducible genes activator
LKSFQQKNLALILFIKEMVTDEVVVGLKTGQSDIGLLSTPLHEGDLMEHNLFYEELFAYAENNSKFSGKKNVIPEEIDIDNLWLMEEGHCLRNQVLYLCELRRAETKNENLHYQAGSIETLINLVDNHGGMTIIPKLATVNLNPSQKKKIHRFADPKPMREISLVVAKGFPKKKLLKNLREEIMSRVPIELNSHKKQFWKPSSPAAVAYSELH